jgi:hypothetical protein
MTLNLFEARLRHEQIAREFDFTPEETEETWDLALQIRDIKYPPGPNAEEEKILIRMGAILSKRIKASKQ